MITDEIFITKVFLKILRFVNFLEKSCWPFFNTFFFAFESLGYQLSVITKKLSKCLSVFISYHQAYQLNTFPLRLAALVPLSDIASLFEHLDVRVLESSSLLEQLSKTYNPRIFDAPEFASFRNKLKSHLTTLIRQAVDSQWEQTDTALEVANIFPCFLPSMGGWLGFF